MNRSEKLGWLVRPGNDSREGGGRRRRAGVASAPAGGCRPCQAPTTPGQARTHFAESVLMEPVTSMSPARNSWYLVQAMAAEAGARYYRDPPQSPRSLEMVASYPVTRGCRARALPGRESRDPKGPAPRRLAPPQGGLRARASAPATSVRLLSRAGFASSGPHRVTGKSRPQVSPSAKEADGTMQ